jgi:hypothetical protein
MRNPGGMTILELQNIAKKGYLIEPKVYNFGVRLMR